MATIVLLVSNLADVSRSCSLSCQRKNVLQHHVVKESHLITSLNDTCEPKITPQQEVFREWFHYLQKYFRELPIIVSGDNFFSPGAPFIVNQFQSEIQSSCTHLQQSILLLTNSIRELQILPEAIN